MTTTVADLDRARNSVLDLSGWGRRFNFYQPRNFAFWGYLLLVGMGMLTIATSLTSRYNASGESVVLAVTLFATYGALFWWFTQRIDRYAKLPAKLMVVAFLWGCFAATFTVGGANDAISSLYAKALGQSWQLDWDAALSAPFTEEPAKGFGMLLLIALAPRLVRTAFDGFILGAFIGLGFQIIEDIVVYAMSSAGPQFVATIVLRMFTPAAHFLWSAIFCAGLVYLLGRPAEPRCVGRGLLLMATSILLHGIWNSLSSVAGSTLVFVGLLIVMIVVTLIIAVRVYALTVAPEREFMREVMSPEMARDVIGAAELDAMAGNRKALKAYRKASHNRRERKHARYVLHAAYDLADELAAARGADTDRVRFAREEVGRIRAGVASVW